MIEALNLPPSTPVRGAPVICMVSGGSDSSALLVRAATGSIDMADGLGPRRLPLESLHVLHVNHCIRGADADGDENFVRDLAEDLGVAFHAVRVDVPGMLSLQGGNLEEVARQMRYAAAWDLAGELCRRAGVDRSCSRILVGHTADDRAETFVMRAATGAAASGLVGLRRSRGIVVRPLLDETRAELRAYLVERGYSWREDATNAQDDALRSYVRNRVCSALENRCPGYAKTLGRGLDVLADEDDLLERLAQQAYRSVRRDGGGAGVALLDADALARIDVALARRVARLALAEAMGREGFLQGRLERRHVEAVVELARNGHGCAALPLGVDARVDGGMVVISDPRRCAVEADASLTVPGSILWGAWRVTALALPLSPDENARERAAGLRAELGGEGLVEGRDFVCIDARTASEGLVLVGAVREGERMEPFGSGSSKPVRSVMGDAGIPAALRGRTPVVRDACGRVLWAVGARVDGRAAWDASTTALLVLKACIVAGGNELAQACL